ncbi:MAG: matrixin family metalloprotease, partial [Dehalococcoidales bacterium]|nr:matrixin family metalloprotease [Dehalococcoidales bacterium]
MKRIWRCRAVLTTLLVLLTALQGSLPGYIGQAPAPALAAGSENAQSVTTFQIANALATPGDNTSLKDLTEGADAIVVGTVIETISYWNDGHTSIFTSAVLSVDEKLKGETTQEQITVNFPGGNVDGLSLWVSDMPSFNVGEQSLLFLKRDAKQQTQGMKGNKQLAGDLYEVYHGYRGKYSVSKEKVGNLPLRDFNDRVKAILQGQVVPETELSALQAPLTFPFSFSGYSWSHPPSPAISFRINENTSDCTGEGAAVQTAAATWNAAGAYFSLNYAGATGTTTVAYNGTNEIIWRDFGSGGTVGLTSIWHLTGNTNILECDMEFNDYYTWSTAATPPAGRYDTQSVALHEFGHYLCLDDLYDDDDSTKVMYGYGSTGQIKRTLHTDDIAGIRSIYGSSLTAPTVTNSSGASNVAQTSARLNGQVSSTGGENPTVHIYWGDNDGGNTAGNWDHDINLGIKAAGSFYSDITGLTGNFPYYYRCYAVNSIGGSWASTTTSFTTSPVAPAVTNSTGASNLAPKSARLNGQVTSTGGANPTVHIYWGDNDGGTTAGNWDHDVNLGAKAAGAFYADISSLQASTTYYYRCYAVNSAGGSWAASTASFTTSPPSLPPSVTTSAADNITSSSARLPGNLTGLGDYSSADVSFLWGSVSGALDHQSITQSLTSPAAFNTSITGLLPSVTYYFKAVAVSDNVTVYG